MNLSQHGVPMVHSLTVMARTVCTKSDQKLPFNTSVAVSGGAISQKANHSDETTKMLIGLRA